MPIHIHDLEASPRNGYKSVWLAELQIPQSVCEAIGATCTHAEPGYNGGATGEESINRCLRTVFQFDPDWFMGQEEQAACLHCTKNRYACLLVTEHCGLVLLPLVEELRVGLKMTETGYWLSEQGKTIDYDSFWEDAKVWVRSQCELRQGGVNQGGYLSSVFFFHVNRAET